MEDFNDSSSNPNNWRWGLFYFNRSDPRILVPKRFGYGYTLNFSKPYAILGMALIVLIVLVTVFPHVRRLIF